MDETIGSSVEDAATAWFVRLRDDTLSEADKAAFEAWLAADPAHARAYGEMERLWRGLGQVDRRPGRVSEPSGTEKAKLEPAFIGRRRALRRMAIAASVAVVAGFGAYALVPPGLLADHRTEAGEQRSLALEDGSRLHLNTASAVSTAFTDEERRVVLHVGEAYFEVKTDGDRPFVVDAGKGQVRVLGTAFSVRRADGAVSVIVTENRVEVSGGSAKEEAAKETAVVAAGRGIRVTDAGLGTVARADAKTALAWRRGRLVFDNRPLGEVLGELERYRQGRILIMDSALEALPVTGSFTIERADAALDTIERTLPVRIHRLSDFLVLVFAESAG